MNYAHDFASRQAFPQDFVSTGAGAEQQQQFSTEFEHATSTATSTMQEQNVYTLSQAGQKMACDVKPRLTKEQHDVLEAHYQNQQKPNTITKRGFAEALNVSLEKVNNWFQNRRAKSKQDAKKQQQGPAGLFSVQQPSQISLGASDSDTSPAFASADYFEMMQHCDADEELLVAHGAHVFEHPQPHHNMANPQLLAVNAEMHNLHMLHSGTDLPQDFAELNRRTLTQEQFDAFNQNDVMLSSGELAHMLSQDPDVLNRFLANYNNSSNNTNDGNSHSQSTDYSNVSSSQSTQPLLHVDIDQSTLDFSSAAIMSGSGPSSEWSDSRSSSSLAQSFEQHTISTPVPQHPVASQWQSAQPVQVDYNQLNQEFSNATPAQHMASEGGVWRGQEGLNRCDSSTSLITQSLHEIGLQTPQTQQQQPTFKSPTPVSSLAARRQRARPAPLGLASLRSQSYSGTPPALASPGSMQPPSGTPPQLRRIKSSNVVAGVSQGRVQKSIAPPQRSPLSWTFSDALTSPHAVRHNSSHSGSALAPPTPMSPHENHAPEQSMKAQQHWQARHNSIAETDAEHAVQYTTTQTFSSPPHTPMFHTGQYFMPPQIVPGALVMENTPPQSAPASQQTFPAGVFSHAPHHAHQYSQPMIVQHPVQQPQPQQQMPQSMPQQVLQQVNYQMPPQMQQQQQVFMAQPQQPQQHVMHMMEQEQMHMVPQFTVTTSAPMELPMHFAQGVPVVDAQGQISLAMPSQIHYVQHNMGTPDSKTGVPSGSQTMFAVNEPMPMAMQVTAQIPRMPSQAPSDFFVHEYTPPHDMKSSATPRRAVDSTPKNYTFTNQTPEHFEKSKKTPSSGSPSSAASD